MSKIDVRLLYQKEHGMELETINNCVPTWPPELRDYFEWLEEQVDVLHKIITKNTHAS